MSAAHDSSSWAYKNPRFSSAAHKLRGARLNFAVYCHYVYNTCVSTICNPIVQIVQYLISTALSPISSLIANFVSNVSSMWTYLTSRLYDIVTFFKNDVAHTLLSRLLRVWDALTPALCKAWRYACNMFFPSLWSKFVQFADMTHYYALLPIQNSFSWVAEGVSRLATFLIENVFTPFCEYLRSAWLSVHDVLCSCAKCAFFDCLLPRVLAMKRVLGDCVAFVCNWLCARVGQVTEATRFVHNLVLSPVWNAMASSAKFAESVLNCWMPSLQAVRRVFRDCVEVGCYLGYLQKLRVARMSNKCVGVARLYVAYVANTWSAIYLRLEKFVETALNPVIEAVRGNVWEPLKHVMCEHVWDPLATFVSRQGPILINFLDENVVTPIANNKVCRRGLSMMGSYFFMFASHVALMMVRNGYHPTTAVTAVLCCHRFVFRFLFAWAVSVVILFSSRYVIGVNENKLWAIYDDIKMWFFQILDYFQLPTLIYHDVLIISPITELDDIYAKLANCSASNTSDARDSSDESKDSKPNWVVPAASDMWQNCGIDVIVDTVVGLDDICWWFMSKILSLFCSIFIYIFIPFGTHMSAKQELSGAHARRRKYLWNKKSMRSHATRSRSSRASFLMDGDFDSIQYESMGGRTMGGFVQQSGSVRSECDSLDDDGADCGIAEFSQFLENEAEETSIARLRSHRGGTNCKKHKVGGKKRKKRVHLTFGGGADVNNFRTKIAKGHLPKKSDITVDGVFHEYYFHDGVKVNKTDDKDDNWENELFCPKYLVGWSDGALRGMRGEAGTNETHETEYYMSVHLNSGGKMSDAKYLERKKLNMVIVLDVSNSMDAPFDQYYNDDISEMAKNIVESQHCDQIWTQKNQKKKKSKLEVAKEAIFAILNNLKHEDRIGIVLFADKAHVAKRLDFVKNCNVEKLKENISNVVELGNTNLEAGYFEAIKQLIDLKQVKQAEKEHYSNRIVFITDGVPTRGIKDKGRLLDLTKQIVYHHEGHSPIYSTFIGVGIDFDSELVQYLNKNVAGSNYYSIQGGIDQFEDKMKNEFDTMVNPLLFNLKFYLRANDDNGWVVDKVYGSNSDELNKQLEEGKSDLNIISIPTLFPTVSRKVKNEKNETVTQAKGGITIIKLKHKNFNILDSGVEQKKEEGKEQNNIDVVVEYEDKYNEMLVSKQSVCFDRNEKREYYDNNDIRKAILLIEYVEMVQKWIDDLNSPQADNNKISKEYRAKFKQFRDHFGHEVKAIGDKSLKKEMEILEKLRTKHSWVVQN